MLTSELNAYRLAGMAECASPDSPDSPGVRFLLRVASDFAERVADGEEYDDDAAYDMAHEVADAAVPIYTHERWVTFVDLAAYNEDPSELGADASDMTELAGVCLYLIAERLVRVLAVPPSRGGRLVSNYESVEVWVAHQPWSDEAKAAVLRAHRYRLERNLNPLARAGQDHRRRHRQAAAGRRPVALAFVSLPADRRRRRLRLAQQPGGPGRKRVPTFPGA